MEHDNETNLTFESVDERLIGLAMRRTGGAKEVFRRIKDDSQIDGWDNHELFIACREVFEAMNRKAMILPADLVTAKLDEHGTLDRVGAEKIQRIVSADFAPNELEATIVAIQGRQQTKQISEKVSTLRQLVNDSEVVDLKAASQLAREITELHDAHDAAAADNIISLTEILDEVQHIEEMPESVPTGFPLLDARLGGGFVKGSYHIVAGSTGTGKTILIMSIWLNMIRAGYRAIYVNYEIPFKLFVKFFFAQITGVNPMRRDLNQDYLQAKKEEASVMIEDLYERGLLLISDPAHGASKMWDEVEDMMRDLAEARDADCIFFDTINSVTAKTVQGQGARWNEYESIAISSERMCMELNIPVIYTAQPKQDVALRDDKTPQLYDVAGGKVISEKAASIVHLLRTDMLDTTRQIDYSELHITKNRVMGQENGFDPIRVKYDPDYKRLYELPTIGQKPAIVDLTGVGAEGPFLSGSSVPAAIPPVPDIGV